MTENNQTFTNKISSLLEMLRIKDTATLDHSTRVANYAKLIGPALNLSIFDQNMLYIGALLHDIGKVTIPETILKKSSKLTTSEYEIIKTHPQAGIEVLESVFPETPLEIKDMILHHHERIDGEGYPSNLKGNEIPYLARILSVIDSYDAMTSNRCYQKRLTLGHTMNELIKGKNTQFDAEIVEIFKNTWEDKMEKVSLR